jgi:hypothetical protein
VNLHILPFLPPWVLPLLHSHDLVPAPTCLPAPPLPHPAFISVISPRLSTSTSAPLDHRHPTPTSSPNSHFTTTTQPSLSTPTTTHHAPLQQHLERELQRLRRRGDNTDLHQDRLRRLQYVPPTSRVTCHTLTPPQQSPSASPPQPPSPPCAPSSPFAHPSPRPQTCASSTPANT